MPPRYAYWTILIDNRPTAFRARDRAELQPTLHQLKRTNPNAEMKWFARGRLWDTPEQAQWAARHAPKPAEQRGRDWRPGGQHKDPRAFKDRPARKDQRAPPPRRHGRPERPAAAERRPPNEKRTAAARKPWHAGRKPGNAARKPWTQDAASKHRKRREDSADEP